MNDQVLNEARNYIGQYLKARRMELGLTQEQLADACGFHRHTIRNIEDGKFWPTLKVFLTLTHHLKCFFFLETHDSQSDVAKAMKKHWKPGNPGGAIRGEIGGN